MFDRRLRINAAGFYTDYKTRITNATGAEINLITGTPQAGTSTVVPFPAGGPGATQCRTYSAATDGAPNPAAGVAVLCIPRTYFFNTPGKVKGFEIEMEARPFEGLSINGAVGFSHFTSADLKIPTRANDRVTALPEWNGTMGVQYHLPVETLGGSVTPRLDWFYTGNIKTSAARNTYNQPAYSLFNGRVTYENEKYNATLAVGVTNIFKKRYYQNFFIYQDIGFPNVNGQPGTPQQWYVEISKRF